QPSSAKRALPPLAKSQCCLLRRPRRVGKTSGEFIGPAVAESIRWAIAVGDFDSLKARRRGGRVVWFISNGIDSSFPKYRSIGPPSNLFCGIQALPFPQIARANSPGCWPC